MRVRPQADDGLERGETARREADVAGGIGETDGGEQRADQAVAARHPSAPGQRQHPVSPSGCGGARPRQRRIEARDRRRRARGMADQLAHAEKLLAHVLRLCATSKSTTRTPFF